MWNVSGLCSERKQKEIADLLACNIVAVQKSWEKEDSKIGYKWFGKPRTSHRNHTLLTVEGRSMTY